MNSKHWFLTVVEAIHLTRVPSYLVSGQSTLLEYRLPLHGCVLRAEGANALSEVT